MACPTPEENIEEDNGYVHPLLHEMEQHPSVVERYYKPKYCINVFQHKNEDQCVLIHSNRVCLVTVAQSHPLFTENHKVVNISFQVTACLNRMNNKVSGKSKRGAQWLGVNAPLCKVTCEGGRMYTLISCVRGQLIEVNEALVDNPQLILEKPQSDGYIAIVLPRLDEHNQEIDKLLSEEEYQKVLQERQAEPTNNDSKTS
ncbi:protein Abitram [Octopus sinensis]|uniref:Protein Abitram n=1 Tax=Octopus sinensis TaxID=2607531 RepID=A0A6P7U2D9_9MOLL|nr:protein Abitram [Octopus sinensis]